MSKFVEGDGVTTKDPDEVLDFTIDWSTWLGVDTISTSAWTVPAGVTEDSDTNSATAATIWLSGGTLGGVYPVINRVVTAAGRTADRTLTVQIESK